MYKQNTVDIFRKTRLRIASIIDPELAYNSIWAISDWLAEHGFSIENCFDGWMNNNGNVSGMIVVNTEYGMIYVYVKTPIHDAWVLDYVE